MSIRLLPQNLINQIAAGEVVERPSAALKELIENSIDAGSTRIDIKIQEGGKTYFCVTDNGKGMTKSELELCIERHATSKLPDDDLFHICFLGFRGEALPSIASVAKLSITSRTKEMDEAWKISVEGGIKKDLAPVPATYGTTVEVRDLFFATPARLKFLKSAQSEMLNIKDTVNRLAMAYPQIHFSLSDEKRTILNYTPAATLLTRIAQVIGKAFDENALAIEADYEGTKLTGFVGLPTYTRSTSQDQYLFVNGRFVKDKVLIGAIRGAFQGLIGHDTHPVLALFLSVPQQEVDVNVHPAKTEVRFANAPKIRGLLVSSIRNVLAENGHRTSSTIGIGALEKSIPVPFSTKSSSFSFNKPSFFNQSLKQEEIIENFNTSDNSFGLQEPQPHSFSDLPSQKQEFINFSEPTFSVKSYEEEHLEQENQISPQTEIFPPLGFAKAQMHETYIVSQTKDSIIITDQHAAHERLTYERLIKNHESLQSQLLLIPEIIDLSEDEAIILLERAEELKTFGFIIEPFGGNSIVVREMPALLNKTNISKLMVDLAQTLKEFEDTVLLKDKIKDICARMACHGSIRAGRNLTIPEMNALLRQMEECTTSGQCIHGRPTYIELKLPDVERLFGRSK
ncbi:MAG: DNA mismatch repair endonuclease MutL [Alphaproteobacteria bacterium]|nr:DNA mismatch repair endonuclease MutL [Alphaproteobacteria bacterium]